MSLRLQKRWEQLGNPQKPGEHAVPGVGEVIVTPHDLENAAQFGANPLVVLAHREDSGLIAQWDIVEIKAD